MVVIQCLQHLQPLVVAVAVLALAGQIIMVEQVALVVAEETKAETVLEQQVPPDKVMQVEVQQVSQHQITQLAAVEVLEVLVAMLQMPQLVEPGA
jgi:hypothetical protein